MLFKESMQSAATLAFKYYAQNSRKLAKCCIFTQNVQRQLQNPFMCMHFVPHVAYNRKIHFARTHYAAQTWSARTVCI